MEPEFGIQEYVSDFAGFSCVIKQRYQDFLVREIDRNGRVVRLTNLNALAIYPDSQEGPSQRDNSVDSTPWSSEIDGQLQDLFNGTRKEAVSIDIHNTDKSQRAEIHQAIRKRFPTLQSETINEGGLRVMKVSLTNPAESRKRKFWASDGRGDYTRFVLYKENEDSHQAVSLISRNLGVKTSTISLAGTKDRRAVTTQLATIYRITSQRLANLSQRLGRIKLGNFEYCENQLYLGDSKGNRFTVIMRNIQADPMVIENDIKTWRDKGFINYYGAQRFGTSSISTHAVGKAILRRQWSEAVDLILHPRSDEKNYLFECCRIWSSTKDPNQAFAAIAPRRNFLCIEGLLLQGIKEHGINDFSNAFRMVPRNSRTLYVHSLQSFIWNKLVSKRVSKYRQRLLIGDLVADNGHEAEESNSKSADSKKKENPVHILNTEDLEVTDPIRLVVPLASANVQFANPEMLDWFNEILSEDGLTLEEFKTAEKQYSVHGDVRQVFVRPLDVEYKFFKYDDPTLPLALSDFDILQGKPEPQSLDSGKYLALSLSFSLPPGSYATMAIRELCRMDMGKQFQSTLNDYVTVDDVSDKTDV